MSTSEVQTRLIDPGPQALATYSARGFAAEVLPIRPSARTWSITQYITVWMGPIHNILSYFTVVGFFALGLSALQVIGAIMTAAVIVSIGYALNGQAAAKYGVPFAMQLRDAFGSKGALIPTAIRGIIAGFVFFGIGSIATSRALDIVVEQVYPGYGQIGGGSTILGLAIPTAISYVITVTITVALFLGGKTFLAKFSTWANPIVFVLIVIAVVLAVHNVGGVGRVLAFHPVDNVPVTALTFITCVCMLVSNWAGPIVNTGDYTRNATSMSAPALGFPIGVIVSYMLFAMVTVAFMASLQAATGGNFDINRPTVFVDAINSIGNPFVIVLLVLSMNVGAIAFAVFGNMLPAGLQLRAQLPSVFTIPSGALLTAVIGTLILPWKFVEATDALFLFYSFIGSMFGPIAGIMLAAYFIERRSTLDLERIYADPKSPDAHVDYNWRAMGVLAVSFIITMAGTVLTDVPFLVTVKNLAFFSGLTIGFVGYASIVLASWRQA